MTPLGFWERAEKCGDLGELVLCIGPPQVFFEPELLINGLVVMPRGENERERWFPPAGGFLASILEHTVELTPLRRHWNQAVVISAELPEGIQ